MQNIDLSSLPSLMSMKERELLFKSSNKVEGNAIEIGSWMGASTIIIASGLRNGKIYAVDPHKGTTAHDANSVKDTFQIFTDNIKKFSVSDKVIPIRKTSEEAFESWNGEKLGMVFVDGNHEYMHAKYDIENWMKFLKNDGILIIHDFGINGDVASVVFDCVVNKVRFIKRSDSLVVFVNDGTTSILSKINLKIYKEIREFLFRNEKRWFAKTTTNLWKLLNNIF
jgi:predicted O-methyltransferase YrrM